MGTSSSKPTPTDAQTKPSAQPAPDPDEEKVLVFTVLGNYADFTTTAVIQRCADPTSPVSQYDTTELKVIRREIQGTKYRISMLSLRLSVFPSFHPPNFERLCLILVPTNRKQPVDKRRALCAK